MARGKGGSVRRRAQAALERFPTLYRWAAMAELILRWLLRQPHDSDYRLISGEPRLILDVGGNRGQSALSFAALFPRAQIITFEPNPDHLGDLRLASRLLRGRMTVHPVALGAADDEAVLWVPTAGRRKVTGEGSLDRRALDEARVRVPIDGVEQHQVRVRRLDSFGLAPDVIKLDVQGTEAAVLHGAPETLAAHRPILLIEAGSADEAVEGVLAPLGYSRSGGPRNWLWEPLASSARSPRAAANPTS